MYRSEKPQDDFQFLGNGLHSSIFKSSSSDEVKKRATKTAATILQKRLIEKIVCQCKKIIYETSMDAINSQLKTIITSCVQDTVQSEWQSTILENFAKLIPEITLSQSIPIKFSKEIVHFQESGVERKIKAQFWKLLPLIIREKMDDEIIRVSNFQRELSASEMKTCCEKIRETCQNGEILEIVSTIESHLTNYEPNINSPAQSIRFVVGNSDRSESHHQPSSSVKLNDVVIQLKSEAVDFDNTFYEMYVAEYDAPKPPA